MEWEWLGALVIGLLWGILILIPAFVAISRGRSPVLWAIFGFFFPLISLVILILVLPPAWPDERLPSQQSSSLAQPRPGDEPRRGNP